MRIACLLVPDLPLRAELRAHPELAGRPFVVATGADARSEIIALSPEAARAGVRLHGSVTHARAACADLQVCVASPALERTSREALLDVATSFSPRAAPVERASGMLASEAAVFLDASGVDRLFQSESAFASAIGARAESLGLPACVSIASSRSVAQLAARRLASSIRHEGVAAPSTFVLEPGEEARFLAPLPIDLLDPDDKLAQRLTRFGVHSVRDLLRLPRRGLAKRLGPDVLRLADLARGHEVATPLPEVGDVRFEEALDLDHPIDRLEPLGFVLRGLLSRLVERLESRGLACGPIDLRLERVDRARDARRIGVAAATRDVNVLLRLLRLGLEAHPPEAAIESVSISTQGVAVRRDQLDLFRPRGPDPAALDRTLAELESLCGPDRVGAPKVADDHRPGAFAQKPFQPPRKLGETTPPATASLPVRALRPPVTAEIRIEGGQPASLRSAVANGHVVHAAGPWRTTGHWWSEDRFAVDHYDVQVSDGTVVRLCFDWLTRTWQIDAIYD